MAFTGKLLMDHQNAGIILGPPPDNAIRVENNETLIRRNLDNFGRKAQQGFELADRCFPIFDEDELCDSRHRRRIQGRVEFRNRNARSGLIRNVVRHIHKSVELRLCGLAAAGGEKGCDQQECQGFKVHSNSAREPLSLDRRASHFSSLNHQEKGRDLEAHG